MDWQFVAVELPYPLYDRQSSPLVQEFPAVGEDKAIAEQLERDCQKDLEGAMSFVGQEVVGRCTYSVG
jgi:hypothetical protein